MFRRSHTLVLEVHRRQICREDLLVSFQRAPATEILCYVHVQRIVGAGIRCLANTVRFASN